MSNLKQKTEASLKRRIRSWEEAASDPHVRNATKKPGSRNPSKGSSMKGPK